MFKKIIITLALVAVIGAVVFGAVNRTMAKNGKESTTQNGYGRNSQEILTHPQTGEVYAEGLGNGGDGRNEQRPFSEAQAAGTYAQGQGNGGKGRGVGRNQAGSQAYLPTANSDELSNDEIAALLYMREEEKLAKDVYATLYTKWSLQLFQNISQSEQTHTDSVKALLDHYGLSDPASSQVGVFTNADLQALYTDLVTRGSQSLAEALKVGGAVEEIDILDLRERLTQTDNADIQKVFTNLERASYNHLRAFASMLNAQTGEVYQPQYMSAEDYQAIIGANAGNNGRGNGQGRNQGGRI